MKTMFTLTVFQILLFVGRSVLAPPPPPSPSGILGAKGLKDSDVWFLMVRRLKGKAIVQSQFSKRTLILNDNHFQINQLCLFGKIKTNRKVPVSCIYHVLLSTRVDSLHMARKLNQARRKVTCEEKKTFEN